MSQQAFALEIDMHRTYLGGGERGERNVSLDNIERIADGLGVEPWVLLRSASDGTAPDFSLQANGVKGFEMRAR